MAAPPGKFIVLWVFNYLITEVRDSPNVHTTDNSFITLNRLNSNKCSMNIGCLHFVSEHAFEDVKNYLT